MGMPLHQFHHEVRPAALGGAGIQHAGDVRMVHQGQRLALGLEAGDDLAGVHARLDDLEGDLAVDRLGLLGHEHPAKTAFADFLQQLVAADDGARPFADGLFFRRDDGLFEEIARPFVGCQQRFHLPAQSGVALAGGIKIGGARLRRVFAGGFRQDFFQSLVFDAHKRSALTL